MDIHVVSAFSEMVQAPLRESILNRASQKGLVDYHFYDFRDFTTDKHHQIDDYPYGGGPGMVLKPEPIIRCTDRILEKIDSGKYLIIIPTPQGETLKQSKAQYLAKYDHLIFICGHYKGIDERVFDYYSPELISIGDYVLSSGEIATLVIIDSIVRLIPGVLNDYDSATSDSFQGDLMDYPHYTRPAEYRGMSVPEVLLSGNHDKIKEWRNLKSIEKTKNKNQRESFGSGCDDE